MAREGYNGKLQLKKQKNNFRKMQNYLRFEVQQREQKLLLMGYEGGSQSQLKSKSIPLIAFVELWNYQKMLIRT